MMLCVEHLYVEVNLYVTLWSFPLSYTVQKQAMAGRLGWDRDTIPAITRPWTNNVMLKLLF